MLCGSAPRSLVLPAVEQECEAARKTSPHWKCRFVKHACRLEFQCGRLPACRPRALCWIATSRLVAKGPPPTSSAFRSSIWLPAFTLLPALSCRHTSPLHQPHPPSDTFSTPSIAFHYSHPPSCFLGCISSSVSLFSPIHLVMCHKNFVCAEARRRLMCVTVVAHV
jgi:hypothetical protein